MDSILEYQWIKVFEDGKTGLPQFDPISGKQRRWDDPVRVPCHVCGGEGGWDIVQPDKGYFFPTYATYQDVFEECHRCHGSGVIEDPVVTQVILASLSNELVERIVANGIPAIATNNKPYRVFLKPGDKVKSYWDNAIEISSHYECGVCGWCFEHEDASKFVECPQCAATDIWFCRRCPVDISDEVRAEKKRREAAYDTFLMNLAEEFRGKISGELNTEEEKRIAEEAMVQLRERQVAARKAIDEWAIANKAFKFIDQRRVRRLTPKDELAGKGKRGEINCPDCDINYGLERWTRLQCIEDVTTYVDYVILVENKFALVVKNHEIVVESL